MGIWERCNLAYLQVTRLVKSGKNNFEERENTRAQDFDFKQFYKLRIGGTSSVSIISVLCCAPYRKGQNYYNWDRKQGVSFHACLLMRVLRPPSVKKAKRHTHKSLLALVTTLTSGGQHEEMTVIASNFSQNSFTKDPYKKRNKGKDTHLQGQKAGFLPTSQTLHQFGHDLAMCCF